MLRRPWSSLSSQMWCLVPKGQFELSLLWEHRAKHLRNAGQIGFNVLLPLFSLHSYWVLS